MVYSESAAIDAQPKNRAMSDTGSLSFEYSFKDMAAKAVFIVIYYSLK